MSLLRKSILVNFTAYVGIAIGILQAAILSRVLGPSGIGQYSLILSALVIAGQVVSLGMPISFLYHTQRNPENISLYLTNAFWFLLLTGFIGGLILVVVMFYNSGYFGSISWFVLLSIIFYMPVAMQRVLCRNFLLVKIEARKLCTMDILGVLTNVILIASLACFGILTINVAILCFIAAACARCCVGWCSMLPALDCSIKPSVRYCRELVVMGIRQSWSDLAILLTMQLNIFIIKYMLDDFESVGYYSRGSRVAMLAVMAGQAVLPMLFSRWASIPIEKLPGHVERVMRVVSCVAVCALIGIVFSAKWIILILYGKEFLPAVQPAQILVSGTVLYLMSKVLIQLLGSRGVPEISAMILFAGLLINLTLSFIFIPRMNITGASIAAALSHLFLLISFLVVVKKRYGICLKNCFVLTGTDMKFIWKSLKGGGAVVSKS